MAKLLKKEKMGQRCKEVLSHFNCAFCGKWWSVGDAPQSKKSWFCPWCGKENKFTSLASA